MMDYLGYKGKVCVVTGASSGMGKAVVDILVELGAEVYALARREIDTPVKKMIKTDLAQKDSIDAAFSHIPEEIDNFFGTAGVAGVKEDFLTTVTVNFIANKYITDEYLTKRIKEGGSIGYITSNGGLRWERPVMKEEILPIISAQGWDDTIKAVESLGETRGNVGYAFSKRAGNYYAATMVPVFGAKKIRINCVLPGATNTGMTDDILVNTRGMENLLKFSGVLGRLAEPKEMAWPLVFMGSDVASYMSGTMMDVDAGTNAMMLAGIMPDIYSMSKPVRSD